MADIERLYSGQRVTAHFKQSSNRHQLLPPGRCQQAGASRALDPIRQNRAIARSLAEHDSPDSRKCPNFSLTYGKASDRRCGQLPVDA